MNINITYDASVNSAPAGFTAGVAAAAQFFTSRFSDPITININVGFGEINGQAMASGALGESETYLAGVSYGQIKGAMTADAKTTDDALAVANLPASDPTNGGNFYLPTAEAKALGLLGASASVDGFVGFSATAPFTYDANNRAVAGKYDFIGTVGHEISEVMGRIDLLGTSLGNTPNTYTALDLFHYSAPGIHDFVGTQANYFSLDGGNTNLDNFNTNTGGDFGDWAASAGHDSFLAFSNSGVMNAISQTDLRLLDVLGYDAASSSTPPSLVHDGSISLAVGATKTIPASQLQFDDNASTHAQETYRVVTAPAHGSLLKNGSATSSFTQADIDNGLIAYREDGSKVSSDSFVFDVTDAVGNHTAAQQFQFQITTPPVVTATDVAATHYQSFAAASLFTASDANNLPLSYGFWDNTPDATSGHFVVNGVAQGAQQFFQLTAAQLAQTTFQAGTTSADLFVNAFDGISWGAWAEFHVNEAPNHPPVVTATDVAATHNQSFAAATLFTASDADHDPLTYAVWDNTPAATSGHFVVNGVAQAAQQFIPLTAAQLAQTTFQAGSTSADLFVNAFDGISWGAWAELHVNVAANHPPVVTATDVAATPNQSFAVSTLFSASDADHDPLSYAVWDNTPDATSGHFVVNGVAQAAQQFIPLTAEQLAQTTFQAGTTSADLFVNAFDGVSWGAWAEFHLYV